LADLEAGPARVPGLGSDGGPRALEGRGQRAEGSVEGRLTEQHDRRDAYERSVRNVAAGYFVKGPPMSYWDVFVIGAGPAGLTAGYLLTRQARNQAGPQHHPH
jgi:NADPH-dependent glutamate synthase beta subunit-like oxidoreductase